MTTFETKPEVMVGFVPIPEGAKNFMGGVGAITWETENGFNGIELPQGSWSILAPTDEISEEQMKEVCESASIFINGDNERVFRNYERVIFDDCNFYWEVKESFASLLTHLKLYGRHLVIFKNEG